MLRKKLGGRPHSGNRTHVKFREESRVLQIFQRMHAESVEMSANVSALLHFASVNNSNNVNKVSLSWLKRDKK